MAKHTHCDLCDKAITPGGPMLTLSISEAVCAKPGRPRMQYTPGTTSKAATGLFEVDAELCAECCSRPVTLRDLLSKLIADEPRKALWPDHPHAIP